MASGDSECGLPSYFRIQVHAYFPLRSASSQLLADLFISDTAALIPKIASKGRAMNVQVANQTMDGEADGLCQSGKHLLPQRELKANYLR